MMRRVEHRSYCFGASEATISSQRESPRGESQLGVSRRLLWDGPASTRRKSPPHDMDSEDAALLAGKQIIDEIADD